MNRLTIFLFLSSLSLFSAEQPQLGLPTHHITVKTFDEITVYPTSDEEEARAPQLIQAIREQIDHRKSQESFPQRLKLRLNENRALIISNMGTAVVTGIVAIIVHLYGKQC